MQISLRHGFLLIFILAMVCALIGSIQDARPGYLVVFGFATVATILTYAVMSPIGSGRFEWTLLKSSFFAGLAIMVILVLLLLIVF